MAEYIKLQSEECVSRRVISDALLHRISELNAQGEKAIPIARELIRFKKFVDGMTPVTPTERTGEWEDVSGEGTAYKCSECGKVMCCNDNFCSNCGAKMGSNAEYERAVDQLEHDILYESTFNSEDGSM